MTGCGANSIWQAAETGQYHDVERMLNDNPNWVNAKDSAGRTPLMNAVHGEHEQIVKLLLDRGADPRITGASNFNALHEARAANNSNITKMIEKKIEELNKAENKGKTGT
jgi:ankyrin repeat protein